MVVDRTPGFETYTTIKPTVEMLSKIQEVIEEYCETELKKHLLKILPEMVDKAVKEYLEKEEPSKEVIKLKKISTNEATTLIKSYIDANQGCRTSDIIYDLELDPELVLSVLSKLKKSKKIRSGDI